MAWRWMTVVAFWILWGGAAQAQGRLVVAVLPFENHTGDPKMDVLRKGLADMLATDLAASGQVAVVERERLADVSGELSLQQDKAFDTATAQRAGKFLGASHVVLGGVVALEPRVRINVRLHAVETNATAVAASVGGTRDKLFELQAALLVKLLTAMGRGSYAAHATDDGRWTRAPDLDAAVQYGQALGALDEGRLKEASDSLQALVKRRPAFGLARVTRDKVEQRIREARSRAQGGREDVATALRTRAAAWLASAAPVETDVEANVARTLGYLWIEVNLAALDLKGQLPLDVRRQRALVLQEMRPRVSVAVEALAKALQRLEAAQGVGDARQRRYVGQFMAKNAATDRTLRGVTLTVDCPKEEATVCAVLGIDSAPPASLVRAGRWRLLALGQLWWLRSVGNISLVPPPVVWGAADGAALEREMRAQVAVHDAAPVDDTTAWQQAWEIRRLLAEWLTAQDRLDDVVALHQVQLDTHLGMPEENRRTVEAALRQAAGLERRTGTQQAMARYDHGWSSCEDMDIRVGLPHVLDRTLSRQGMEAIAPMVTRLLTACASQPKTVTYVHSHVALWCADLGQCACYRQHMDAYVASGGSARDRAGYDQNKASGCAVALDGGAGTP